MNNSYTVRIEPDPGLVGKSFRGNDFYITKFRFVSEKSTFRVQAEGRKMLSHGGMSKVENEVQYDFPHDRVPEVVWDELRTGIESSIEKDMAKYEQWDGMVDEYRPAFITDLS